MLNSHRIACRDIKRSNLSQQMYFFHIFLKRFAAHKMCMMMMKWNGKEKEEEESVSVKKLNHQRVRRHVMIF